MGSGRGAHLQGGALQEPVWWGSGGVGVWRGVPAVPGVPPQPASRPRARAPDRSRDASFFMAHFLLSCSSKGGGIPKSEHKNALESNSRTRAFRLVPPCFTLPRRQGPYGVLLILPRRRQFRHDLCLWQSAAPLRDHLPKASVPVSCSGLCAVSPALSVPYLHTLHSSRLRALFSSAWVALSLQPESSSCQLHILHKEGQQSNCLPPSKFTCRRGCLSRLICRLTFRRSFLRPARLVMRWSVRVLAGGRHQ